MVGGGDGDVQGGGHILLRGEGDAHGGVVLIDSHDSEGLVLPVQLHPDLVPQSGVGVPLIQVLHQPVADHADAPPAVQILLADGPARQQVRVVDSQVLLVDPGEGDVGIQPPVPGHAAAGGGGDADSGDSLAVPLPQGLQHLVGDQVLLFRRRHPQDGLHAAHAAGLLLEEHGDVGGPQGAHGPGDGPGEAVAHREDADDRGDADDDAQHGEKGAHLVGPEALQGHPDALTDPHSAPPPPCPPRRAGRPAW